MIFGFYCFHLIECKSKEKTDKTPIPNYWIYFLELHIVIWQENYYSHKILLQSIKICQWGNKIFFQVSLNSSFFRVCQKLPSFKMLIDFFCDGKRKRKRLPSELFRANNLETFSRSRKEGASFMASIQVKLRACTQLLSRDSWPRGSMIWIYISNLH